MGVVLLIMGGCTQDESIILFDDAYFPLRTGTFCVYDITETFYSPLEPPQTITYELKAQVVDSFPNEENGFTYVIHRFTRATEENPWEFQETRSARINDQYAIVTEGNTSYARLAFALYVSRQWDGNLFNALGEDEYTVESVDETFSLVDGPEFEHCAVVIQENVYNNLVYRDVRKEVYSRDVGMVYKESQVWNYSCGGGTCTGEINDGYHLIQVLKDHGQN